MYVLNEIDLISSLTEKLLCVKVGHLPRFEGSHNPVALATGFRDLKLATWHLQNFLGLMTGQNLIVVSFQEF